MQSGCSAEARGQSQGWAKLARCSDCSPLLLEGHRGRNISARKKSSPVSGDGADEQKCLIVELRAMRADLGKDAALDDLERSRCLIRNQGLETIQPKLAIR